MRKLNRGSAPACLGQYRHGRDNWSMTSPDPACRGAIWQQITCMQGRFCAYCESELDRTHPKSHIEHFYRRNSYPQRTFDWTNLFGSCKNSNSCGEYKDNQAPSSIDLTKVCKPDEMDPANYLYFAADGKVTPKAGISNIDQEIAENTIKVFNLNGNSKLVNKRKQAARNERPWVSTYYQLCEQLQNAGSGQGLEMTQLIEEELAKEFEQHEERIKNSAHSAVLRQVWLLD